MLKLELGNISLDSRKNKFSKRAITLWTSRVVHSPVYIAFQDPNGQSFEKSDLSSGLTLL